MSLPRCATPVPFTSLVDYWLGETTGVDEEQLDEHLLGCDACSQRLQGIAELAGGVRALARRGVIPAIVSGPLLERLTKEGIKVREYRVEPNGSVNCTVAPEDDLLVARLRASLAGVARLDLILIDLMQPGETRLCEIPFHPRADAVLVMPPIDLVRLQSAHTGKMRLVAVDDTQERVLGEYVFRHTPWPSSDQAG
jgi:Putative zinc-finger